MPPPHRLSDWPWVEVRVDCTLCTRRGCYRLARLAARYGADMALDRLLADLARDCPWYRSDPRKYEARCGIRYPDYCIRRPTVESRASHRNAPDGPVRVLTVADLPGPTVAVVCRPCKRRGVLRVDRLIQRYGADLPLPTLLRRLAANCPGLLETTPRCQAVYEHPIEHL